jgi:hypothetical protein
MDRLTADGAVAGVWTDRQHPCHDARLSPLTIAETVSANNPDPLFDWDMHVSL